MHNQIIQEQKLQFVACGEPTGLVNSIKRYRELPTLNMFTPSVRHNPSTVVQEKNSLHSRDIKVFATPSRVSSTPPTTLSTTTIL